VWRKHTTAPKTARAAKPVLVIEPLRALLAELREAEGNPAKGAILRGVKLSEEGKPKPLNLNRPASGSLQDKLKFGRTSRFWGVVIWWNLLEWKELVTSPVSGGHLYGLDI